MQPSGVMGEKKKLPTTKEINKPKGHCLCSRTVAMTIAFHKVRMRICCGNRNTSSLICSLVFEEEVDFHCSCVSSRMTRGKTIKTIKTKSNLMLCVFFWALASKTVLSDTIVCHIIIICFLVWRWKGVTTKNK